MHNAEELGDRVVELLSPDRAADMALRAIEARADDLARLNRSVAHRRSTSNRLALGKLLDEAVI